MRVRIGITVGDPRGVGPEVMAAAAREAAAADPDLELLFLGPQGSLPPNFEGASSGEWDGSAAEAGRLSGLALEEAVRLALAGEVHGLTTGPIHKPSLAKAGWDYAGQTEMLQELTGASEVAMLMVAERTRLGGPLRVLLATTHLPLRSVAQAITSQLIHTQCVLLSQALKVEWGMPSPRVALCALNPHASDDGLFGDEEARIMEPAVAALAERGLVIHGPLPADTVFTRALKGEFDAVVAPYHDVGMAVFKTASFGSGVNVTLGLPFPRTSPDHGTAFDIAGQGVARHSSALEAIKLSARLARNRFDTPVAAV